MLKMAIKTSFWGFLILFWGVGFFFSCKKTSDTAPQLEGEMLRMECFGRWGIKAYFVDRADSLFYVIPDDLPSRFEQDSMTVRFNAELRPNELPLLFPDPSISPSAIFQGVVWDLSER